MREAAITFQNLPRELKAPSTIHRMNEGSRMVKVVRKFASHEEADRAEDEYYESLTPTERMDIMLELFKRGQGGTFKRLARVCRITSLRKS